MIKWKGQVLITPDESYPEVIPSMTLAELNPTIPYGLCQCGCGQRTRIERGMVKMYVAHHHKIGNRFKHNHGVRLSKPPFEAFVDGEPCFMVPLSDGIRCAIIDRDDLPLISGECWQYTGGYAARNSRPGERRYIRMHQLVLPTPRGFVADHINGNRLDNRRCNLRPASRNQNGINKVLQSNNRSGYPGVSWHRQCGKWTVRVVIDGKARYRGLYDSFDKAVEVRKSEEIQQYGDFRPRV